MTERAGQPWTESEVQQLLAQFDAGAPLSNLVKGHQRTDTAITNRLARNNRIIYVLGAWHKIDPLPWVME